MKIAFLIMLAALASGCNTTRRFDPLPAPHPGRIAEYSEVRHLLLFPDLSTHQN